MLNVLCPTLNQAKTAAHYAFVHCTSELLARLVGTTACAQSVQQSSNYQQSTTDKFGAIVQSSKAIVQHGASWPSHLTRSAAHGQQGLNCLHVKLNKEQTLYRLLSEMQLWRAANLTTAKLRYSSSCSSTLSPSPGSEDFSSNNRRPHTSTYKPT